MAMTKKEKAEVEELRQRLETLAALRWTEPVAPDVPIPSEWKDPLAKGFLFNAYGSGVEIQPACSSPVHHAIGRDDKTNSQGPRRLFSSRLLALKAARYEVELASAHKLARIDKMIENEMAATKGSK